VESDTKGGNGNTPGIEWKRPGIAWPLGVRLFAGASTSVVAANDELD
jgi:hypothetical protein